MHSLLNSKPSTVYFFGRHAPLSRAIKIHTFFWTSQYLPTLSFFFLGQRIKINTFGKITIPYTYFSLFFCDACYRYIWKTLCLYRNN